MFPARPSSSPTPFGIALFPPDAVFPPVIFAQSVQPAPGPVPTGVPGTLYYQYMESDYQAVNPRTLAAFEAGGLTEGNYYVEVRGWYWNGSAYVPMTSQGQLIHVYNGYPHLELGSTVRPSAGGHRAHLGCRLRQREGRRHHHRQLQRGRQTSSAT